MKESTMAKVFTLKTSGTTAPARNGSVTELDSAASSRLMARAHRRAKPRHRFTKLSALMAVYNEEATLATSVQAVLSARLPRGLDREIVLVDDRSTDASWRIAQQLACEHPQV